MPTYRLQAEFNDEQMAEFNRLVAEAGLSTKKELLSNALVLFEWAMEERKKGRVICSMNDDETGKRELRMPSLEHAARAESNRIPPG